MGRPGHRRCSRSRAFSFMISGFERRESAEVTAAMSNWADLSLPGTPIGHRPTGRSHGASRTEPRGRLSVASAIILR